MFGDLNCVCERLYASANIDLQPVPVPLLEIEALTHMRMEEAYEIWDVH